MVAYIPIYQLHSVPALSAFHVAVDVDEVLAVITSCAPWLFPNTPDGLNLEKHPDEFCRTMCALVEKGEKVPFVLNDQKVLFRSTNRYEQVLISISRCTRRVLESSR